MEIQAIMYNGKAIVAVPDHVEEVMVIRKGGSFVFNLPTDERRTIQRVSNEETIR